MKNVMRVLRLGFTGIEILLVLIIFVVVLATLASCMSGGDSSGRKTGRSEEAAHAAEEAARTARLVDGLNRAASNDPPADAAPSVDPAAPDVTPGDDWTEILDGILDGL
jgi:type II secretory pathway pseudopilin PulG